MKTTSHRIGPALAVVALAVACGDGGPSRAPARGDASAVASHAALDATACSFTPAHPKHASAACKTCHACVGVVEFDPAGAAVMPGQPAPAFDVGAKTCANAACHGVRPGTFSYWFPDGTGEPALNTVAYGSAPKPTPAWPTTGIACHACHENPPRDGVWHTGYHANQGPSSAYNQCQFCHPDAAGANGVGTTVTDAALHGNGVVEVQARFASRCFTCH